MQIKQEKCQSHNQQDSNSKMGSSYLASANISRGMLSQVSQQWCLEKDRAHYLLRHDVALRRISLPGLHKLGISLRCRTSPLRGSMPLRSRRSAWCHTTSSSKNLNRSSSSGRLNRLLDGNAWGGCRVLTPYVIVTLQLLSNLMTGSLSRPLHGVILIVCIRARGVQSSCPSPIWKSDAYYHDHPM